jgi:hypothetical protein
MGNFKKIPDFFASRRGIKQASFQQRPESASFGLFGSTFVISIKGIDLAAFAKDSQPNDPNSSIQLIKVDYNSENNYKIGNSVNWVDKKNNLRYGKISHINYDETGGIMNVQIHDEEMILRTIAFTQIKNRIKNNGEPEVPSFRDTIFNGGNGALGIIGQDTRDFNRNS